MYIHVKALAGAKKEVLNRKTDDHFEISVKEKAERNMANQRIMEIVAESFSLPMGKVKIISGHHSPSKILSVDI